MIQYSLASVAPSWPGAGFLVDLDSPDIDALCVTYVTSHSSPFFRLYGHLGHRIGFCTLGGQLAPHLGHMNLRMVTIHPPL